MYEMERMAQTIVKRRKLVLVLAALLLVPSVFGMAATRINYDILTYLPQELDSMIGEAALENAVSRVEPALVLLCSLLVGLILLSVMLPLMNIMAAIG